MSTITNAINTLCKSTEMSYTSAPEVRRAFLLGLWYKQFPDYMIEHLSKCHNWDLEYIDPQNYGNYNYEQVYPNFYKFQFISETGDSWHQCYSDLRNCGWKRLKVHREGGRLQYLMQAVRDDMPEGYSTLTLLLDISIATCKQVQVGTRTVEQPIFETKCDDLSELPEDDAAVPPMNPEIQSDMGAEIVPLVVIDDIEGIELEEGQIPTAAEWAKDAPKDSIPF